MPLELEEPGHGAEGDIVVGQPELAADLGAGPRRVQERVDVHAAVDGQILLGPADAGGQGLLGHRVADADDRVAAPAPPSARAAM